MEEQLLSHATNSEYAHLVYSESNDRFIFCNKVSFNRNDTVHLAEQAVQKTNQTVAQVSNKTSEELITELKFVPCEFSRDELFSVVLINDVELAGELKRRNKAGNLTVQDLTDIKEVDSDKFSTWYYYSNQAPILAFVNSDWRDSHNIKENLVILSTSDLDPNPYFLRGFLGITLDTDYIMVN